MRARKLHGLFSSAVLLLCAVVGEAAGQRVDPRRIVDLHINSERDNVSTQVSVMEGGRMLFTMKGVGTFGFEPVAVDAGAGRFTITALRGEGPAASQTFRILETVRATRGVPARFRSVPYVTIVIEGVRVAEAPSAPSFMLASAPRRPTIGAFQTSTCCLICGDKTTCGCRVWNDCGFCCLTPCCPKAVITDPATAALPWAPARTLAGFGTESRCRAVPDHERVFTRRETDGSITLLAAIP